MTNFHHQIKDNITRSSKTIFDKLEFSDPLYLSDETLNFLLSEELVGCSLEGLPLRTRSKRVKELICGALGYPIPKSFKKTQPRFLAQNFDVYVQKSNNLQIWNEDISPDRRYVVIALDENDIIKKITVITGNKLSDFDNTGTITQKYQARFLDFEGDKNELFSISDTKNFTKFLANKTFEDFECSPAEAPFPNKLLPINEVYRRLLKIIGQKFQNPSASQERTRGVELQKLACSALGYDHYGDTGQFPDIFNQLLEIKLQTSPTIDLGLVLPSSEEIFYSGNNGVANLSYRDARYAVFCADVQDTEILIRKVVVITGTQFFERFQRFEGNVINGKIQLRLPDSFFN